MARRTPPQASIQVKTEENEMEQSVEKIIERNLLEVFNARDADSRRAALDELGIKMASLSIRAAFMRASKKLTPLFSSFSRSLKTMCSRSVGHDNLCMASVAFLGRMDRPMTLSGLLALTLV
jgi:hypothetical protein